MPQLSLIVLSSGYVLVLAYGDEGLPFKSLLVWFRNSYGMSTLASDGWLKCVCFLGPIADPLGENSFFLNPRQG